MAETGSQTLISRSRHVEIESEAPVVGKPGSSVSAAAYILQRLVSNELSRRSASGWGLTVDMPSTRLKTSARHYIAGWGHEVFRFSQGSRR
ncbi:cyclin-dependent kinases regulatory subunit 1 isoform X4 [Puntigrus tetrazona]|uniref:cyclin-dependent kinases regulatory subunit 1 isoform X4 n=1 Tax=Puntigrus tetrazona TaxID=1606681 RepID=UPI001C8A2547|nr:cyclin-dependent kinases regulatory subunit 1 isoform X4 [Puntigrus tetrazona]